MKAKAIIMILLLSILALSSVACRGESPQSAPTPVSRITATPALPSIEVEATLSQVTRLPGEVVTIEFSVNNTGAETAPLTLDGEELGTDIPWGSVVIRSQPLYGCPNGGMVTVDGLGRCEVGRINACGFVFWDGGRRRWWHRLKQKAGMSVPGGTSNRPGLSWLKSDNRPIFWMRSRRRTSRRL